MRKVGLVLVLVLLASMMGVFAQGQVEQKKEEVDLSQPVTLTIWTHEDAARKKIEKGFIEEFCKKYPNVTVDYQTYPSSKMAELLTVAFSADQGPDIFNQSQSVIRQFVVEGRTSTLDPSWIGEGSTDDVINRYIPGALAAVIDEDGLHGLPLEYTNLCMYVNKQIFREAGLDAEKDYPRTWEDVMALSEKLVQRNGEIITRRGYDFRYPSYTQQFLPMVEQLGGKLISDDGKSAVIGDEAWIRLFDYMKQWGPTGKNLGGPTYTAARKCFDKNDNEIAMSDSGLYQEARMKGSNPTFYNSGDWMIVPFPQWADAKQHVSGSVACHYYMVNGQIPKVRQIYAWKLIDFMLSHGEEYLKAVNLVQPTYALFESETFRKTPYSSVFKDDMEHAHLTFYAEKSSAINDKFKAAVEASMLQGEDSRKVLEDFRKAVQAILDEE